MGDLRVTKESIIAELQHIAVLALARGERSSIKQINVALGQLGADPVPEIPLKAARTALYRHYDKAGRLLYVGISLSAVVRLIQHKSEASWHYDIARIEVEWLDTRELAAKAEEVAIKTEKPLHNLVHAKLGDALKGAKRLGRILHGPSR